MKCVASQCRTGVLCPQPSNPLIARSSKSKFLECLQNPSSWVSVPCSLYSSHTGFLFFKHAHLLTPGLLHMLFCVPSMLFLQPSFIWLILLHPSNLSFTGPASEKASLTPRLGQVSCDQSQGQPCLLFFNTHHLVFPGS